MADFTGEAEAAGFFTAGEEDDDEAEATFFGVGVVDVDDTTFLGTGLAVAAGVVGFLGVAGAGEVEEAGSEDPFSLAAFRRIFLRCPGFTFNPSKS